MHALVSLSAGGTVLAAEWQAQGVALATRWRLRELSACVMGRDEGAFMRALEADEDPAELVGRMTPGEVAKAAVRDRLRLDDWALWSRTAAPRLARRLGVDLDAAEGALVELVLDRIAEIVEAQA